jgi:PHP family Zn ribbon phosphoesterase
MSPAAMMHRLKELNIEWIAITDHNSLANCPPYAKVAADNGIAFTYGVEIQTSEEIHLLAYFDAADRAMQFNRVLYEALLPIPNDAEFFGDQVVIDADEKIVRLEERALSNSVLWDIAETKAKIEEYDGFCVPAHIDAVANSIIGQLGFLPREMHFPLLGITAVLTIKDYLMLHPDMAELSFLRASDAHYLSDLGCGSSRICVEEPTVKELVMAAKRLDERKIIS